MPSRTARALGTVKNTGTTTIEFEVHLTFGGVSTPRTRTGALAPGASSTSIGLSVTKEVAYGATEAAAVFLHRVSPEPQDYIAATLPVSYTEPHLLSGELVGFTPGISALAPEDEAWLEELLGEGVQRVT